MLDIGVGIIPHLTAVIRDEGWDYDVKVELLFSEEEVRFFAQSVTVSVSEFPAREIAEQTISITVDGETKLVKIDSRPQPLVMGNRQKPLEMQEKKLREITSVVLRQVKVAEAVRVAASGGLFEKHDSENRPYSRQDLYGSSGELHWVSEIGEQITSRGPTEQNLRIIGFSYMIALLSGEAPAKAVERQFSLPARTASNWIARARETGFIRKPKVVWRASLGDQTAQYDWNY